MVDDETRRAVTSSRSLLSVNALVLGTIGIGLLNSIAITALFGLTRRLDAYYAAAQLPNLFMVLCIDYLGRNFLPVFTRARKVSYETASEVASSVVTIVALLSAAVALVLALASEPLFSLLLPGFEPADVELVCRYFWIMAPALVLTALTPFYEYVWQHDEAYTRISVIRVAPSCANLVAILGAGPFIGEYALPVGHTVGQAVLFALLAWRVPYRYRPRILVRPEWEKRIFTNSAIVMGSGLLVRTRGILANYLASLIGEGAIAAMSLGYRLLEPLERTTFSGVRMILFSRLSRLAADENRREMARLYRFGLPAAFLVLAPPLWWVALESDALVAVLFQRGAFDANMTALVALVIMGLAASIAFSGVNTLLSSAFYALDRVVVPALVMPLGTVVYVVCALAAYRPLGVLGLASALSVVNVTVFGLMLYCLGRQLPDLGRLRIAGQVAAYVALAGAALGLPAALLEGVAWNPVAEAAATLLIGSGLYLGVLSAARDHTLFELIDYFRRAHPRLARRAGEAT
ncbi:MAG TPA: lipid II flippase MurJ [Gammaproteobacteria bacterium]